MTYSKKLDEFIDDVLGGYCRRPGRDGVSLFELMFGVRSRLAYESPHIEYVPNNVGFVLELEIAAVKKNLSDRFILKTKPSESTLSAGKWYSCVDKRTKYIIG